MNEIFQKVYLPSSPPTKQALPSPMRLFEEGLLKILLFHGTLPLRFLHMIDVINKYAEAERHEKHQRSTQTEKEEVRMREIETTSQGQFQIWREHVITETG